MSSGVYLLLNPSEFDMNCLTTSELHLIKLSFYEVPPGLSPLEDVKGLKTVIPRDEEEWYFYLLFVVGLKSRLSPLYKNLYESRETIGSVPDRSSL